MHADSFTTPLDGLPDPERDRQFYEGVPPRRLVAWFVDLVIILLIGVPLAMLFGLLTLGFGFAIFPLIVAGVGFLYRTCDARRRLGDLGHALHRHRVPPRATAAASTSPPRSCTRRSTRSASSFFVLQLISCATIVGSRYRQSLGDMVLGTTAINRPAD